MHSMHICKYQRNLIKLFSLETMYANKPERIYNNIIFVD